MYFDSYQNKCVFKYNYTILVNKFMMYQKDGEKIQCAIYNKMQWCLFI